MAQLQLTCLGDFSIVLDGMPLTAFPTDKVRALLVYLAVERGEHPRSDLAQFFWPGYSDTSARNSLRQALHQLRQLLPDPTSDSPWLLLTRQTVQLNPAAAVGVDVDVIMFNGLLAKCAAHAHEGIIGCQPCLARLRQAVDLYRGDFLAGFTVADSDPFEEWRRVLQEQIHIQMLDTLTFLADGAEAAGDEEVALQAAQRQLALEPWQEAAHRRIIRILAQRGQRAAAIAQYNRCRQVLAEEFGVEPDVETTALYEQIQSGEFDKMTRWQDDKRKESLHPAIQSSSHPVIQSPPHNLPNALPPLIGRTQALAEISSHLQAQKTRLLTLVGPGGMGKTSLALAAGREHLPLFADGVWFVSLAAINTATALAPAIADVLGVSLQEGDPRTSLLQALRSKQMLLLLDNFEHLLTEGSTGAATVDLVVDLLESAQRLQILVTSRERLKLRSEQLYTVQPLPFAESATLAEAAALPSVRLFVQATQRSDTAFQLTVGNLAAVLRICRLVQGMPLGLELAAANAGGAPPNIIADAIEQSAEFLSVDWRDVPQRQRSMRAVFEWSWQLLSPLEQQILRQSSVFLGGFAYDAAQVVLQATPSALSRLVDKSLLQWQVTSNGEGRYLLHELLRQFAAEELQKLPTEAASVAASHSAYYLNFVAVQENRLARQEARQAANEIEMEIHNVRQAWRWAATHQMDNDAQTLAGLGRAAYSLWSFYTQRASRAEAEQMLRFALQQATPIPADASSILADANDGPVINQRRQAMSKLLALHALALVVQNKHSEAVATAQQAIALSQSGGSMETVVIASQALGMAHTYQNGMAEARLCFEETVQLAQRYHTHFAISEGVVDAEIMAREYLASTTFDAGDYPGSRAYLHANLQLSQRLNRPLGEQRCYYRLARLAYFYGDYRTARQEYECALALAQTLGARMSEAYALMGLGEVLRLQGAYRPAEEALAQGLVLARTHDDGYGLAWALVELTRLHCLLGRITLADGWVAQLAQVQATHALLPESRVAILLAFALHAQAAGKGEQALAYAEEANQLNAPLVVYRVAHCLITLGSVRADRQRWAAAAAAYQAVLACYAQFNNRTLMVEAQAGLAQLFWQQGDLAGALAQVEALLPVLAVEPRAGINSPYLAYWIGYQVLAANNDPRAVQLLQQGYDLLQQDAAALDDESRQRFLTAVPPHRDLIAAYEELQERQDKAQALAELPLPLSLRSAELTSKPLPASPSFLHDWAEMPVVDFFVERTAEIAQLTAWLTPAPAPEVPVQLISILGMGGMGKTTLAAAVTKAVAPQFAVVIWRSLINAPPLSELLRNWLQILSRQTLTTLPDSVDEQLRLLLTYLQQERCLIVLDNVESIFVAEAPAPTAIPQPQSRAGVTRPGYEGYDQLFQRLASSEHQSCLLLTSREQPYALSRVGRQAQSATGRIRLLPLNGLDQQAGHALLESNGLHASAAETAQLIESYSGNPLALQIVAATIADFFGGDVTAFQQEEGPLFDGMRLVLDQQFARLSQLEREILVWLAIEREAITVPELRSNFVQPVDTAPLLEALQALQNRSLLEKRDAGFTLQNVIIEYTTEYLVAQVYQEIVDDKVTRRSARSAEPWQDDKMKMASDHPVIQSSGHPVILSFLNRFALIKAQAKEYVRQSQARLILQPLANHLLTNLGKTQLATHARAMVQRLQADAPLTPGYAAGNLLNLLIESEVDITRDDFSRLAIWQANLRDKTALELNLAHADLSGACFTDIFTHILALAYHPYHPWIVGGDRAGTIYRWHADNGHLLATYQGHTRCVYDLAFSPDGRLLASASEDGTARIWETESGQTRHLLDGHHTFVNSVAFRADGHWLATGGDDCTVCLWHVESGQLLHRLTGHDARVCRVAFPPPTARTPVDQSGQTNSLTDGVSKLLASCGDDQTVRLWDSTSGQLVHCLRGHTGHVEDVAFSAALSGHPRWLASGSDDGTVRIWEVATGQPRHILPAYTSAARALAFHPTANILASGGDSLVRLWNATTGESLHLLPGHGFWITDLAFSPDGRLLVSGSEDGTVRVWETQSGHPLQVLTGINNWVCDLAVDDDGGLSVSVIKGHRVSLWDAPGGITRHLLRNHTKAVIVADFSPDGRWLLSGGEDADVCLWAAASGRCQATLPGHAHQVTAVAVSHDGQWAATGALDHVVRLWQVGGARQTTAAQGALVYSLVGHPGRIHALAFAPDDRLLASSGEQSLCLWDVHRGILLHQMTGYPLPLETLAFSPDGTLLASGSEDHNIYLWEVASGTQRAVLRGHRGTVFALAFHPNGKTLVSGSGDSCVALWDVERGTLLQMLTGHDSWVTAVAFYPDGEHIATGSADGAVKRWHCQEGRCLETYYAKGTYAGMNISGVTGINAAQKAALRALGAVEG